MRRCDDVNECSGYIQKCERFALYIYTESNLKMYCLIDMSYFTFIFFYHSRFIEEEEIHRPGLLLVVGSIGLLVNLIGLVLLYGKEFEATFTTHSVSRKTFQTFYSDL